MILTSENYFSREASLAYMSNSQYSSFIECDSKAMAMLSGECEDSNKDAFLIGSYVHAWNDNKLEEFKELNKDTLYQKNGKMYAKYEIGQKMIDAIKQDSFSMFVLSQGESEVILTAEMFGTPWKIMLDRDDEKKWVEIKTTRSIKELSWIYNEITDKNEQVNFIQKWNYIRNAAVYAEIERLARGRESWKEAVMLAVSKETPVDKEIISLFNPNVQEDVNVFTEKLREVEINMPRILAVKSGLEKPIPCNTCDYCISKKKLKHIVHWSTIGNQRC